MLEQASNYEQSCLNSINILDSLNDLIELNSDIFTACQMEEELHKKLSEIGKIYMHKYFMNITNNDLGKEIKDDNGLVFKKHNNSTKDYYSVFGKIAVKRQGYRREGFNTIFPLDHQCDMPKKTYSYYLQDIMNTLSAQNTFTDSKNIIKKILHIDIHESSLEDLTESNSVYYDDFYKEKDVSKLDNEGEIQVRSFDGKGISMIKEESAKIKGRQSKGEKRMKKKEALVGVSYTVDKNIRTAEEIATNLIYPEKVKTKNPELTTPKAKNIRRMASLIKPKAEVIKEIERDASLRNSNNLRKNVVLIDGMPSLQKMVEKNFKLLTNYVIVLDIIHVIEYLYLAAHAFHTESSPEAKKFVYKQLIKILKGDIGRVIGGIKQSSVKQKIKGSKLVTINKVIKYLTNHKSIMKYNEYIENGFPIGTGVVESTCKSLVKARMDGAGKRWSMIGAEAMLKLRSLKGSNDWEAYHKFYMKAEFLKRKEKMNFSLSKVG